MKVVPLNSQVLVAPDKPREMTEGGIALPSTAQERKTTGTIVSVGPDVTNLERAQRVIFGRHAGYPWDDLLILNETDIMGVIE